MSHDMRAYGLWGLVLIHSAVFVIFAFSFARPTTGRDWRTFGTFSALATTGPYARVRHPHSIPFAMILLGFLFMWPTLLTLVMFPVLVAMYIMLARREERDARAEFGDQWDAYATRTPALIPRFHRRFSSAGTHNEETT